MLFPVLHFVDNRKLLYASWVDGVSGLGVVKHLHRPVRRSIKFRTQCLVSTIPFAALEMVPLRRSRCRDEMTCEEDRK
jgi:hypothetical protein